MIKVLPRTWPGSNKPGGFARVTFCHYTIINNEETLLLASSSDQEKNGKLIRDTGDDVITDATATTTAAETAAETAATMTTVIEKERVLTHVDVRYVV